MARVRALIGVGRNQARRVNPLHHHHHYYGRRHPSSWRRELDLGAGGRWSSWRRAADLGQGSNNETCKLDARGRALAQSIRRTSEYAPNATNLVNTRATWSVPLRVARRNSQQLPATTTRADKVPQDGARTEFQAA